MAFPPLPETITGSFATPQQDEDQGPARTDTRALRGGCWLISYKPTGQPLVAYDGTLRVEPFTSGAATVSGDLYQRRLTRVLLDNDANTMPPFPLPPRPIRPTYILGPGPSPAGGIPIQRRAQYRYYLRVTNVGSLSTTGTFPLRFEMWRLASSTSNTWVNDGIYSADMVWMRAPAGYPWSQDYAEGDLKSPAGLIVGRFKMGRVSDNYRKAVVEIDTAPGCQIPLDSGFGHSWDMVFRNLAWDVSVAGDQRNVALASVTNGQWTDAQMHEAMLAYRKRVDLDSVWHYHILSVNTILSTPRGIMYDAYATDSNNVPREGVGIANDWIVPSESEWGSEQGKKFADSKPLFFRTAVHELGHALGLYHDTADNGFMNTTDVIAGNSTPSNPFPGNIKWQYAPQGIRGLRHFPDPYIRPGGVSFGQESFETPTVADADAEFIMDDLTVKVTPLQSEIPIGAPVRVSVELVNSGSNTVFVPADISLKSEYVSGEVKKVDGSARSFKPLILCVDDTPAIKGLEPGESIRTDLTLLRGGQGALFHSSGLFEIRFTVRWPLDHHRTAFYTRSGSNTVFVLPAETPAHAKTAHDILTTPDTHLVLVMGQGSKGHLKEGVDTIKEAVNDKVLGEHYASIEAKRLLQLGDEERVQRALKLIDGKHLVCSGPEKKKLHKLVERAKKNGNCNEHDSNLMVSQLDGDKRKNSHEYVKV